MAELRGNVHIHVAENVTLENLHGMVDKITEMCGCRTCGLLGIDLQLTGDPEQFQQIAKLPGVKSASFGE
jgi:hypothetical protein